MRHIIVSDEAKKKLEKIKILRPQDTSMAQTIDHLIYVYEEQQFKPKTAEELFNKKRFP